MWQQALRSGARDLLPPEADDAELAEAIERAAARSDTVPRRPERTRQPRTDPAGRISRDVAKGRLRQDDAGYELAYALAAAKGAARSSSSTTTCSSVTLPVL